MDAYVYIRIRTGSMMSVLTALAAKATVRRAIGTVGEWDVLVHVEGPDLATLATTVAAEIHLVEGVVRTVTAPVVPPDRVGIAGWSAPRAPALIPDACYVHIRAEAGAVSGLAERLAELPDIAGVAVLGGPYDLVACVAQPWEVASGVIVEQIHGLPGIVSTNTLISFPYDEPEEERDQFSAWS